MHKNNLGMTLIEVLVAVTLLSIIGLGILSLQYILTQNQTLVINSYKSVDESNRVVTNFIREVRTARTSDSGAYILETLNDQEIRFYSDIDHDNLTEKVHYYLSGTTLIKGVIEPTGYPQQYPANQEVLTTLTSHVRNSTTPIFYYYNSSWPQDTTNNPLTPNHRLSDTNIIKIYLVVNNQTNDPASNFVLESFAQIRMLKNNL